MVKFWALFMSFGLVLSASAQKSQLRKGIWRGELERNDGYNIVINFEVVAKKGKTVVYIKNADNRLEADDITTTKDSVFIKLPFFDSQFRLAFSGEGKLTGNWIKTLADRDVVLPVTAVHNANYRFIVNNNSVPADVKGRWAVSFIDTVTQKPMESVGIFQQKGSKVTGSFLTPYGDYRYLEGVVDGDSLKLSGFDGGYALLFLAKVEGNQKISNAKFFTGAGPATQIWNAERDENAQLPDASTATRVKPGVEPKLDFTFKSVDGEDISINDPRFRNKVVVIQILGSWCPNCLDETAFLVDVYKEYQSKGVEIIGLAYERTTDFAKSQAAARNFMKRLKVNYPVLIAPVAVSDPERVEKTLPQIEKIPAFPTSIFIGRNGEIELIHAGFNGPGTGEAEYKKQKEEYYHIIDRLLQK